MSDFSASGTKYFWLNLSMGIGLSVISFVAAIAPLNIVAIRVDEKICLWEPESSFIGRLLLENKAITAAKVKVMNADQNEDERLLVTAKHKNEIKVMDVLPGSHKALVSRGIRRYREMKYLTATAYYPGPECTGKTDGITYSGKKAGYGIVAVDPDVIPLGTELYIEGYGFAEAADIGGAIRGNKIDLCYETYREAINYGRKKVKVYILE